MKDQAQREINNIQEKLENGESLSKDDLIKLLTLKLIVTKNEQ